MAVGASEDGAVDEDGDDWAGTTHDLVERYGYHGEGEVGDGNVQGEEQGEGEESQV